MPHFTFLISHPEVLKYGTGLWFVHESLVGHVKTTMLQYDDVAENVNNKWFFKVDRKWRTCKAVFSYIGNTRVRREDEVL